MPSTTVVPAGNGLPELTFDLTADILTACPYFIGMTADGLAAMCANHGDPVKVDQLLTAGLVGGGTNHKEARGYIHRMRHTPNNSRVEYATMDDLLRQVVANATS
jgi:hypothetical protein